MKYLLILVLMTSAYANEVWDHKLIEEGRRIVKITGCNDCHTPMYGERNGNIPEIDWLVGSTVGFKGPWGTTYPSNLRLLVKSFKEKSLIHYVRNKKYLPPMPGYIFKDMTDQELKAMYAFISYLGPAGTVAPVYLPPTEKPSTSYIYFMPVKD